MSKKKMREEFKGLNLYSKREYKEIWDDSAIILDTNILLNLYRYSDDTRKNILNVLSSFKDRIWIPYQVIREYYKNRDKVIKESTKEIERLERSITEKLEEISEEIRKDSKKIQSINDLKNNVDSEKEEVKKILEELKTKNNDSLEEKNLNIENEIFKLIDDRYEEKFEYSEIESVISEGNKRIKENRPPGYKDFEKEERYNEFQINGDYIIFNSMIEYAKSNNKNVIFITDDQKEDWYQEINGEKIGGRRELLYEFNCNTGKLLLIYSSEGFINKYNEMNPSSSISDETVKEIEKVNKTYKYINYMSKNDENLYFSKFYDYNSYQRARYVKDMFEEIKRLNSELIDKQKSDTEIAEYLSMRIIKNLKNLKEYLKKEYEYESLAIDRLYSKLNMLKELGNYFMFCRNVSLILVEMKNIISKSEDFVVQN